MTADAIYLETILGAKFVGSLENDIVVLGCVFIIWRLLGGSMLGTALTSPLLSLAPGTVPVFVPTVAKRTAMYDSSSLEVGIRSNSKVVALLGA